MKKLLCLITIFSIATIMQVTNAAANQISSKDTNTPKKKIELIVVNCDGPHIGYFDDKKGKQHCVSVKKTQKNNN
jgi:hypothetical protein